MPQLNSTIEPEVLPEPPVERVPGFWESRTGRRLAASVLSALGLLTFIYGFFFVQYARLTDERLAAGPFSNTVGIYASPIAISKGDSSTPEEIVARLKRSGYTTARGNLTGWYETGANSVQIYPGRDSYAGAGEAWAVEFANGKISRIVSMRDRGERNSYELEPQLLASLSDQREKRRLVRFADIPKSLVNALVSVEDKHFFHHSGFDAPRIFKAAYIDMKSGHKDQGASTLTMQLARGMWLDPDKNWARKLQELLITIHLEEKLTKQQIFEYYANEVYLGRRSTFSINGFAEAAHTYFGKSLAQITPSEAALLAGLVQRPSYYNPERYPQRARDRRDTVLALMKQNGYLNAVEYSAATQVPVKIAPEHSENLESQYFVDLMNKELQTRLGDRDKRIRAVYTTLDPDLQAAAQEAVDAGMKVVDRQLRARKATLPPDQPQVALVAIDPRTGEVKAMVGGRDYRTSQLNHALAMRQPGSAFKPFVYAAALNTAIEGGSTVFTPASVVSDVPTTFLFGGKAYRPGDYHQGFMGEVTLRTALAHSQNIVAVQLAQQVGYRKVVAMAKRAGLNDAIQPTPSVALGAYETTPLEMAGAYTIFANRGTHVAPTTITLARAPDGTVAYQRETSQNPALDPRVAYLMVNMMQDVVRSGTGAGIRSYGFNQPAAGKTGTSRDGWFAGFTSELLCVVWVGFDDNRELKLEGAHSALPVWAEFMKRAAKLSRYRDAKPFQAPRGIVSEEICEESGKLPGPYCVDVRNDVFIAGTQPASECDHHTLSGDRYLDRTNLTADTRRN